MSTRLKICGLTTLADARFCAAAGADFLGFIQYDKSPRYIPPTEAAAIIEWLYGCQSVGVFVNASADEVNRAVETAGFAYVQLHGEESPETCSLIDRPIIKTLHVGPGTKPAGLRLMMAPFEEIVEAFLLDTRKDGLRGGTGERFDWDVARDLSRTHRIFLAGGIDADNVRGAVEAVQPYAIDLSSGLESAPGVKDFDKVTAFVDAFRATAE